MGPTQVVVMGFFFIYCKTNFVINVRMCSPALDLEECKTERMTDVLLMLF